ncbi:hypothetical protein CEXT_275001 [Caerostris extrusa]|uniref:Uncharacterized protein n=1 Tax=Caerostris extrusa TaxID=172846 RepID=A0AAV4ML49_CAEEX|nr:hypothetical protein CEXT_275001 [Caerostris extrusa]
MELSAPGPTPNLEDRSPDIIRSGKVCRLLSSLDFLTVKIFTGWCYQPNPTPKPGGPPDIIRSGPGAGFLVPAIRCDPRHWPSNFQDMHVRGFLNGEDFYRLEDRWRQGAVPQGTIPIFSRLPEATYSTPVTIWRQNFITDK